MQGESLLIMLVLMVGLKISKSRKIKETVSKTDGV